MRTKPFRHSVKGYEDLAVDEPELTPRLYIEERLLAGHGLGLLVVSNSILPEVMTPGKRRRPTPARPYRSDENWQQDLFRKGLYIQAFLGGRALDKIYKDSVNRVDAACRLAYLAGMASTAYKGHADIRLVSPMLTGWWIDGPALCGEWSHYDFTTGLLVEGHPGVWLYESEGRDHSARAEGVSSAVLSNDKTVQTIASAVHAAQEGSWPKFRQNVLRLPGPQPVG